MGRRGITFPKYLAFIPVGTSQLTLIYPDSIALRFHAGCPTLAVVARVGSFILGLAKPYAQ
jgi:hypothetical protein